jgi:hypothetical protein
MLRVSHSTCDRDPKFREAFWAGRNATVSGLKKKQIEMALAGSVPMLIHTGKHILGQRDAVDKTGDVKIEVIMSDAVKRAC